jgi:hypothetical protein
MMDTGDEKLQRLISSWNGASDVARAQFVDVYADEIVYCDRRGRIKLGYGFIRRDELSPDPSPKIKTISSKDLQD